VEDVLIRHGNFEQLGFGVLWVYQNIPGLREKYAGNLQ
jgi:hypothetical protein